MLEACWQSTLSQRAPGGRRPFVKRPVTSTASAVDPAGIYALTRQGAVFHFFNINNGLRGSAQQL